MKDFLARLGQKMVELGYSGGAGTCENMGITGHLDIRLFGPDGQLKQHGEVKNLVVSYGDAWLAYTIAGSIVGNTNSMWAELGVGTLTASKASVNISSYINNSSLAISANYPVRVNSWGAGAGEWTIWRWSWGAGVATNGSIGEVGMRTQAGSFVAWAMVAPNVNKASGDTLQIDWGWKFLGA
jgi:hypothetical protein